MMHLIQLLILTIVPISITTTLAAPIPRPIPHERDGFVLPPTTLTEKQVLFGQALNAFITGGFQKLADRMDPITLGPGKTFIWTNGQHDVKASTEDMKEAIFQKYFAQAGPRGRGGRKSGGKGRVTVG